MAKVLVVNLERSSMRRAFMSAQLNKYKIEHEFIRAFDASELSESDVEAANAKPVRSGPLCSGEIACVRSHAAACLALAQQQEHEFGLILEDDVILGPALKKVLNALESIQSTQEVTLLYTPIYRPVELQDPKHLFQSYELLQPKPLTDTWGAQGYFLSKEQARRLYDAMLPVQARADDWSWYVHQGALNHLSVVFPFPIVHAEFNSDVNKLDLKALDFRKFLSKMIHQWRIFPVYQLALVMRQRRAEKRQCKYLRRCGITVERTFLI